LIFRRGRAGRSTRRCAAESSVFGLHRANGEPVLAATAPWHRLDIAMPADLTEEVARIVGYDKVGVTLLDTALPPQRRNFALETEETDPGHPHRLWSLGYASTTR
jgi:phenylalanyl-tRNA synthetase beta subunit